jgi:hypothetical protein
MGRPALVNNRWHARHDGEIGCHKHSLDRQLQKRRLSGWVRHESAILLAGFMTIAID